MRTLRLVTILIATTAIARGLDGLGDALAARSMLGPGTWARVALIDNAPARGLETRTPYPPEVYALVFELSGVLWFYCDADGTQSLSLVRGRLQADKDDPGPLFRAISHRFVSWKWVDEPAPRRSTARADVPNACFIKSIAVLRLRSAAGLTMEAPRLLSYYVDTPAGRRGHTILVFGYAGSLRAVDPDDPCTVVRLPADACTDLLGISRYMGGRQVAAARVLPLSGFAGPTPEEQLAAINHLAGHPD